MENKYNDIDVFGLITGIVGYSLITAWVIWGVYDCWHWWQVAQSFR